MGQGGGREEGGGRGVDGRIWWAEQCRRRLRVQCAHRAQLLGGRRLVGDGDTIRHELTHQVGLLVHHQCGPARGVAQILGRLLAEVEG